MALSEQRLQHVLNSPTGPLGRRLATRGVQAESLAKSIATTEGLVRTGRYRASIRWRLLQPLALELLSDVPYSRVLERGADPHIIRASAAGGLWWEEKPNQKPGWALFPDHGRPVPSVNHPGSKPYRILARAIRAAFGRL